MRRRVPDRSYRRGLTEAVKNTPFFTRSSRELGREAIPRSARARTFQASVRACLFFAVFAYQAHAQSPTLPSLSVTDPIFRQLSSDVEEARKLQSVPGFSVKDAAATLTVYQYVPKAGDDLFSVAARCGIPYETIVTANRMIQGGSLTPGKPLIIPAAPGLFIPAAPDSDLERIAAGARAETADSAAVTLRPSGLPVLYRYYPGAQFTPTERAFFLNVAFRFPLPAARVTSGFGLRANPVTGTLKQHAGVDLAAPAGTEVYAARDGTVVEVGSDPIYGNYIVVEHEGSWKSLYGHLSAVLTDLRKSVRSGTILGHVGSTGQSTGPHLHFELRRNGEARDPAALLPRGIGR